MALASVGSVVRSTLDAWRALVRSPGLVAAAVLSLGIAIGANLTVFGVLRAIEFPTLPYPDADRLVQIDASNVSRGAAGYPVSLPDFQAVRRSSRTFSSVAASGDVILTLRGASEPSRIAGKRVSGDWFATLGVPATLGRTLTDADLAAAPTVVLGHRLWREQFGGERNAVGQVVQIDGQPHTVVGVMPPRFDEDVDAWVPLAESPDRAPRDDRQFTAIARLAPTASLDAARTELATVAGNLAAEFRETNEGWQLAPTPLARLRARESGGGWFQLQAAVGFLLLVAAANVANLLLARAVSRRREMAIRTALGATRWQRFRLVIAEGLVLTVIATAVGVLLSVWGADALTSLATLPASVHVPFDVVTGVAAAGIACGVTLIIALAPATFAARMDADTALRESGARGASASRGQRRLRTLLMCTEVAAALVLVAGASLMARTLRNRQQRDLGFDPRNALRGEVMLEGRRYDDPSSLRSAVAGIRRAIAGQPGVRAVGASTFPFAARLGTPTRISAPDRDDDLLGANAPRAIASITPGFLPAMSIAVRRGRDLAATDAHGTTLVAVVNEEVARRAWPGADPLGRAFRIHAVDDAGRDITPTVTVVGVASSTLRSPMHPAALPLVYLAYDQFPGRNVTLVARAGAPERLIAGVKAAVRDVDPELIVEDLKTLEADVGGFLQPTRLYAIMLEGFAALALLLAAIGIYASMAYSVTQRARELAIRLALGAEPARLVRRVLGEGLRIAIAGGVIGILVARAGGRILASLVYGVETSDPLSFAAATLLLLAVAIAGSWLPARRASAMDPAGALRVD